MKKIEKSDIQKLLLDILIEFKKYCEKNELKCLLTGGTLLGAIRHKGFIPWDDDIDLYLLKEDYEKLLKLALENPYIDSEKKYKILVPGHDGNYYPFIKIVNTKTVVYERNISKKNSIGLWLDVFCLSYWPDDINESKKIVKSNRKYVRLNELMICGNIKDNKYKIIYPIAFIIQKVLLFLGFDRYYFSKKIIAMDKLNNSNFLGNVLWPVGIKDRYDASIWKEFVNVEFEGYEFLAPKDYDSFLIQLYGDYMKLPPVEERITHDFEAYYLEEK